MGTEKKVKLAVVMELWVTTDDKPNLKGIKEELEEGLGKKGCVLTVHGCSDDCRVTAIKKVWEKDSSEAEEREE